MKIEYLADHPDYLPVLARWHYEAFKRLDPQATVEKYIAKLQHTLRRGEIPVTFVALSGNTLLGSASLFHRDMSTREELMPWLAAVYVAPEYRRQGVGSALVRWAVVEAKGIGVEKLYLYTPDKEHFYAQLAWSVLERTEYRGWKVVIMEIDLTGVTTR